MHTDAHMGWLIESQIIHSIYTLLYTDLRWRWEIRLHKLHI